MKEINKFEKKIKNWNAWTLRSLQYYPCHLLRTLVESQSVPVTRDTLGDEVCIVVSLSVGVTSIESC